jgi:hypothetical protein
MTLYRLIPAAALIVAAACGGAAADAERSASTTPAAENDAQRAARIALALQAAPTKTDSVLTANNLTADGLEALMYRVAQDSTLSAEYGRLTNR